VTVEESVVVCDGEAVLSFTFEDMNRYHGGGSPGGVAHAFKVLERGLPLLDPGAIPQRRTIVLETSFGGPGARDAFELVTRAVTGERYLLEPALARPEWGRARERFVFRLGYGERRVTLGLRRGYVSDAFVDLAATPARSPVQERELTEMKAEMARRVMSAAAGDVYEVLDVS
jgi:hypothetical protein